MADDRMAGGSLAGIRRGYNGFPADAAAARGTLTAGDGLGFSESGSICLRTL